MNMENKKIWKYGLDINENKPNKTVFQLKQEYIYKHYGADAQLGKLEEECLELALAIKHRNRFEYSGYANLLEEIADVENLIEQIKFNIPYCREGIKAWKEHKVDRELDRISQDLQNKGLEEESKELDCRFDL